MTTILKALVGSRAHGLHREDSDWDWRGIYVQPTSAILSLGYSPKSVQWLEGKEDFTNYEIGHFLMLATKANPSVLELLVSPVTETQEIEGRNWGHEIRGLFPYLYSPRDAFNAFSGYSFNQRKKLLDDKDGRKWKYATAYIRTLQNLCDLLRTGTCSLAISDPSRVALLRQIRDGKVTAGEIINIADELSARAEAELANVVDRQNIDRVNTFLLDVRRNFWDAPS